jgi:hypothetical protein
VKFFDVRVSLELVPVTLPEMLMTRRGFADDNDGGGIDFAIRPT